MPHTVCSLGLLVHKITDSRLQDIAESLCQRLTSVSGKKAQQRDIASIGLKTVIAEASGNQAQALVTITAPLLVDGLSKPVCKGATPFPYLSLDPSDLSVTLSVWCNRVTWMS